jgi:hypothetical protein
MAENSEWNEVPENGITLGPEEALLKEIEKNKALKVEKLGLKNEIEKLRLENAHLSDENKNLNYKLKQLTPPKTREPSITSGKATPRPISKLLISVAVTATFILFLFFLFF